jgi:hypothetical protein
MDRSAIVQMQSVNTPTLATSTTIMAANNARVALMIQNQDTNALKVCLGGTATSSVYHVVLKACTGAADGSGGIFSMVGPVTFTGAITCFSSSTPSYTYIEI